MDRACLVGAGLAVVAAAFTFIPAAQGAQGQVNGFGQGSARASIWSFPNLPPATPNFNVSNTQAPVINLGPGLPGADPRTQVHFQAGDNWRTTSQIRAASGDTVDWHSMLPHVTATTSDATGTLDVIASEPLGGNSRLFTVTWSASDPGVAMHIGWFENGSLLFQTPIMIGPFNRVDTYLVTATGQINLLEMEVSAAATSLVPGPGAFAVFAAGGLLTVRRRRRE
jgi:hypothetical protein